MSRKPLASVLAFAFAFASAPGRAQTPAPARGVSPPKAGEGPERVAQPPKSLELALKCGSDAVPYYRTSSYNVWTRDKSTGGAIMGFPGPLEMKFEGIALQLIGRPDLTGGSFWGEWGVPLEVPPGSRTLTAKAGNLQASCTVVVKKAASHLELAAAWMDAAPDALKSLDLPGTKYIRAYVTLKVAVTQGLAPLKGQKIRLRINGKEQPAGTTNEDGKVVLYGKAAPGSNAVEALFDESANVVPSSSSVTVQVPK